jgi:hypothetical protein
MDEGHLIPEPPHKDDVLFRSRLPDWQNNACIDTTKPGGDEHAVTEGYRRGARRLVEYVMENGREQDYLVYPILFLYRHHIELSLKHIIRRAPFVIERALTKSESKNLHHGHQLDLLWLDLKPMFAAVCEAAGWEKVSSVDEEGVENHIRQLTELDPDSFSFRYPGNRQGVLFARIADSNKSSPLRRNGRTPGRLPRCFGYGGLRSLRCKAGNGSRI